MKFCDSVISYFDMNFCISINLHFRMLALPAVFMLMTWSSNRPGPTAEATQVMVTLEYWCFFLNLCKRKDFFFYGFPLA